jgi:hypothetical protein
MEDVSTWTKAWGLDLGQFQGPAGPDLRPASARCENIGKTWLQSSHHHFLGPTQPSSSSSHIPIGGFLELDAW